MSIISAGGAVVGSTGAYQIERSLRFNSADSAYLNRTFGTPTAQNTSTTSFWLKKTFTPGAGGTVIFAAGATATNNAIWIQWNSTDIIGISNSAGAALCTSTAVIRDPSAWYHFCVVNNAGTWTIYSNNVSIATGSGTCNINQGSTVHYIGSANGNYYSNILLTEFHFIDGQALAPTDFGEFNSTTGVWQPKAYTGTYGNNGFYLPFSDNTSTTTLGYDAAGSNDWTLNNFSVTAGAGNDSLVDSPTRYGTDTGAGGEVRGNYCTWNPLAVGTNITTANGNLDATASSSSNAMLKGTFGVASGKWYWEVTLSSGTSAWAGSVIKDSAGLNYSALSSGDAYSYSNNGDKFNGQSSSAYGNTYTTNDLISVALDMDSGKVWFAKNGTWQASGDPAAGTNEAFSGISGTYMPAALLNTATGIANFGQRPFAYTAPSGFKALCTTNLPEPTIKQGDDYFGALLWTGNDASGRTIATGQSGVTGDVSFTPDLVWIKSRSNATNHTLTDVLRGGTAQLRSNLTDAESQFGDMNLTFTNGGFTNAGSAANESTRTFVAWNWKANGAGSSNTAGTITSTVSVNTTSGFSIVTYTGTGANATVGHGLGVAPSMIIVKGRMATNWTMYHSSLSGNTYYIILNSTAAQSNTVGSTYWNSTSPTSTVFSIGTDANVNSSNVAGMVAYCFAPVAGYSAFGSYTGNGSTDGVFIYLGFRPRYVLIKRTNTTENWHVMDTARNPYNYMDLSLYPNLANAEVATSGHAIDFVSNGIKMRNSNTGYNASGSTYIYAAFAENPFAYSLAR